MCRPPVTTESPDCGLLGISAFALARTDFDGEPSGLPETDHRMAARSLVVCRAATAAVAVPGWIVEAILL
ncbi:hypothetical protein D2E59_09040 [Mycobacteroides abscessus]|uniref:Uncharacterized protein n=1 Tax=Mycobacteroides abscessus TaxID=36809 RepID=A0ABD7HIM2_9MYCO|nr:hypothetical protein DDT46_15860 [Mycobacteroides abscessus]PVA77497.1 hypothetical protein DDJ37_02120 [Mycobacteroides abscessus]PVB18953.1 hypothetical protein DDJ40_03765 [Mycobacteroides abscessus]PVB23698.1 hypothetical protein DDJ71_01965 [Mycobacteroides abscessus]RIR11636.1 hypothetical protein D2E27_19090 [Mycobacteroides abscessus]